jgi:hypothetical protein
MTDEERLHRGSRAKEILDNEEFQAAFDAIKQDLIDSWQNIPATSKSDHVDARERIHLSLTLLSKVKASLTTTMETGRLAAEELKFQKSMAQKAKAFLGLNSSQ